MVQRQKYKTTAKTVLQDFLKSQGYYLVCYIGYCVDEKKRYAKRVDLRKVERYPLVEENITENEIWEWAKTQPIFNNYYKTNKRCGCMYCPMASKINMAYLLKYYPDNFNFMIERMRETEKIREAELGRPFRVTSSNPKYNADYLDHTIRTKWVGILEQRENNEQQNFFKEIDNANRFD